MIKICCIIILVSFLFSCKQENPNIHSDKVVELQSVNTKEIQLDTSYTKTKVYVPIYSDIYQRTRLDKTLLTATLSIRNTSERDSIFIKRVDYFNTRGSLVRKYLKSTVFLRPLETIEYVVEEKDTLGGSGANFIVEYKAKANATPLVQSVMIGGLANRSFAFMTEGIIVKE